MTSATCASCGTMLNQGSAFCGACGARVVAPAVEPAAAVAPEPEVGRVRATLPPSDMRMSLVAFVLAVAWLGGVGSVLGIAFGRAALQRAGGTADEPWARAAIATGTGMLVAMLAAAIWVITRP